MSWIDAFWHTVNLFAAPVWTALILVLLAKWVWRQPLAGVAWRRLWGESALAGSVGVGLALLVWGADGTLRGYALWLALASMPLAWRLMRV